MDRKAFSERDICTKFITPAIAKGGWDVQLQVRENVHLTKGRVIVRGKLVSRGTAKFADYVLYAKPNANVPLAIVEAKDNNHGVGDGMQQGLGYADMLDVPFVFSSNGDGFLLHDRTGQSAKVEQHLSLDEFPAPDELWRRYCAWKTLTPASEAIVTQDYYTDGGGNGTAQPNLSAKDVGRFLVPLPPLDEQRRVVARIDGLLSRCDDVEAKLRRAEDRASKLVEAVVQDMVA